MNYYITLYLKKRNDLIIITIILFYPLYKV